MKQIVVKDIHKYFDGLEILKGIDLEIAKGEILTFIGPSGGGKSTLLRCINLLEDYEEGQILYNGKDIKENSFNLEQYRREVGMIFQRFNLFNNLNVLENLNIGQIKVLKRTKEEATVKSEQMLKKVGLEQFANQKVQRLSGGQMQRVAIARSLCMDPEVILLDEPTSALDPQMVDEVLEVIKVHRSSPPATARRGKAAVWAEAPLGRRCGGGSSAPSSMRILASARCVVTRTHDSVRPN